MKYILLACGTVISSLFVHFSVEAQTAATDNKLSQSITFRPISKEPSVLGIFQGRPPCAGLVQQLKLETPQDCVKLKWEVIFYRDPSTLQPTTYRLLIVGGGDIVQQDGSSYRQKRIEGKWQIIKGAKSNPDAEVYQLELGKPGENLYMLKGDENLLFILDENKEFRIGNEDFCYTLNKVELVAGNK